MQELVDITQEVEKLVKAGGIQRGICHVHSGHTTTAILVNENEPALKQDLLRLLSGWIKRGEGWSHGHNAHAHLKSFILGNSRIIPVINGSLGIGTWQSVFFLELDGPRQREIVVTIIGE